MSTEDIERLRSIKTFPSLVKYLRDELDWPIESDDFDELTFDYEPEELGLDAKAAVKIKEIKQLRPLASNQPWGIFFVNFEPKRLPVVVLRRILRSLVIKKRQSANKPQQAAWQLHDLLFISAYGESEHRDITLANFSDDSKAGDLPTLKVLGWDDEDTVLHLAHAHDVLKEKLRWPENPADLENWRRTWSQAFTLKHREVIGTSKEMAERMAELATAIRKRVNTVLKVESEKGPMRKLMTAFREALIHDLKEDDFADMYAQTITYGLLSARVSRPMGLTADNIKDMVPPVTNPFLRDLLSTFLTVGGRKGKVDFDELGINDVVQALRDANMEAVMRDFDDKNPQEDPVIHFYELFLKEYDPKKRMQRGVFFTPRPVVSFIVRSVDEILRKEFGLADGLADTTTWGEMAKCHPELKIPDGAKPDDPFVQILDPACGTGTFLVEVIDLIHRTMMLKWRKQGHMALEFQNLWNEYVADHLLPRLYGFELMMAPYAIAHMKIGLKLYETGYSFRSHERARIYLTNSLEPPQDFSDRFEFDAPALAHEAQAVNAVKRTKRFTIVVGNPPYDYESQNTGDYVSRLIEPYFLVDGHRLQERNPRGLQDDYVKFFRLAEHTLEVSRSGVLAFITNHSFLDNVTFRGMRQHLIVGSTSAWFLDLHGNANKVELSPDGSPDSNVFEIKQGVAISLLLKADDHAEFTKVFHSDLWGSSEEKSRCLIENTYTSLKYEAVTPKAPYYLFVPTGEDAGDDFTTFDSIATVFPVHSGGLNTLRDGLLISFDKSTLTSMLADFCNASISDSQFRVKYAVEGDTRDWNLPERRALAKAKGYSYYAKKVALCLYRPFDIRWIVLDDDLAAYLRHETTDHFGRSDSLGLATLRQSINGLGVLVSRLPYGQHKIADPYSRSFVFPLYVFQTSRGLGLAHPKAQNLSPGFLAKLHSALGQEHAANGQLRHEVSAEDILSYIYAVLYSPTYRARYAEFLKIDFPRLALTGSPELFRAVAKLGGELVALHLMESPKLEKYITKYAGKGNSEVAKGYPKFVAAVYDRRSESVASLNSRNEPTPADRRSQTAATMTGNVHINPTRWFEGVPEDVWNFHIGGYQVCEKWLKDRRGRVLSEEDIAHYQKIVVALKETVRLMAEIDKVIEAHGGWPGAFVTSAAKTEG